MAGQDLAQGGGRQETRARARELGIVIGRLECGRRNAITDVPGVLVGHSTLLWGEPGPAAVSGVVRTGVTAIWPRREVWTDMAYAGAFALNGNGDLTGIPWVEESGLLGTPIVLTNTHSVGVVRDAVISYYYEKTTGTQEPWMMPVVAETWDGWLSDLNGMHVRREHVYQALETAAAGPVDEGCVGGGTGMVCFEFKGGIGSSSRRFELAGRAFHLGVLVQANFGIREQLRINGVPVGREIPTSAVPGRKAEPGSPPPGGGSIVAVIATDVPLLPDQCKRLARRASLALGRMGSVAMDNSGDIFIAFSTGNEVPGGAGAMGRQIIPVATVRHDLMSGLFEAVVDCTEESILNALCAARTMQGILGRTAHAIPLDRLREVLGKAARG